MVLVAQLGEESSAESVFGIAPGECIGELSAIDGKPISALVRAVSDVRVLRIADYDGIEKKVRERYS